MALLHTVVAFVIALLVLVVIHELGHFFTAKLFGVKVEEFGIGYPPRARKLFTWKGTLFTLNWLPLGGYVKIFGEESPSADDAVAVAEYSKASFSHKPFWQRGTIIVAGVLANVLLAILLYAASFSTGFLGSPEDFPRAHVLGQQQVIVASVLDASPAKEAGIQPGDAVVGLGSGTDTDTPVTARELTDFIHSHGTEPLRVTVLRGTTLKTLAATPRAGLSSGKPGIGIDIAEAAHMRLPFFQALKYGASYTFQEFGEILRTLKQLVAGLFGRGSSIASSLSGPVGIAQIAGNALTLGIGSFLSFMALISVNLAVLNLLPFPALDGGRFILECFATKGHSRIPQKAVNAVNTVGFLILIALMLFVTYHDILRLIR